MKGARIALGLILIMAMGLYIADMAFARSTSLTTTLIITVKEPPKSVLAQNDKNARMVEKIAKEQPMIRPQITEAVLDTTFAGKKVYTITDAL